MLVALVAAPRGFTQSVAGVGGMGNKQQQTATDAADQAGIRLEAGVGAQAKSLAEEFARLKTG